MRIHNVTFENINSLYGRHAIDFDDKNIRDSGLLLIYGAMGSGKTTIMDAITLCLYGKTPRLEEEKPGAVLMSQGTGSCSSEVVFSSDGTTYIAFWSQATARRRPNATLQPAKARLSVKGGKILAEKLSDYYRMIVEITHLDYSQFVTSVMLPQGKFASFLLEKSSERAPILEEITKTNIYSDISIRVQAHFSAEQRELERMQDLLSSLPLLSEQSREEKQKELESQCKELEEAKQTTEKLTHQKETWDAINRKRRQKEEIKEKQNSLTRHKQDNEKDLSRLASFLAVKSLCKTYQDLTDERSEILEAKTDIGAKETLLTERQKEEETISGNERQKNLLALRWDDEKKERITKLSAAREKDKEIAKQKQLLKQKQQDLEKANQSYADSLADQEETDLAYALLLQQEEENNQWLSLHKEDESLGVFLSGLKERIAFIASEEQKLEELFIKSASQEQETTTYGKKLAEAETIAEQKEKELRAIVDEQNNLERERQDLLKGYTLSKLYATKTDLEKGKAAYQLVMSMEERREQLQEGKPCPLCGSTTHPYASHLPPPVANDKSIAAFEDRIARIEAIQEKQQEGGTSKESAEEAVRTTSKTVQERKAALAVAEEKSKELIRQQTDKRESLSQRKTEAAETLRPYGYEEWKPSALKELMAREKTWETHTDEKQGIHDALNIKKSKQETARSNVDHAQTDGKERASQKVEASKELERLQTERKELLGDLSVDLEEEEIKERDAEMKESQEKAHAAHQKIHDQCEGLKSAIHELTLRLSSLEEDVEKNHSSFLHGLESLNVPDEASFANLLLDEKEEARISAIRKTIDEESAALDALSKEYEREPEPSDPERPEAEILQALSAAQESKEMIAQRIGAVKTELKSDDKLRETQQEKQKEIVKKEETVQSWKSFNSLIGSSDGKKFRDFAQAITLRRLIRQANEELKRLNDRYLLADDSEKPLDFFVYDTWQGDAKRTVKSLSGGESFIVSLALALGLADMNAKAVKIDSLFLDEGFGTLNPQEAEAIVKALSAIGGNGKMIAIISHVPVLQEYITAKIEAVKNESGKSVLKGTGVSD